MKAIELPVRADDSIHILAWSADEILPIGIGLVVGMVVEQALILTLIGMAVSRLYSRFCDVRTRGFIEHRANYYGLGFYRSRSMTNPFIRFFYP